MKSKVFTGSIICIHMQKKSSSGVKTTSNKCIQIINTLTNIRRKQSAKINYGLWVYSIHIIF